MNGNPPAAKTVVPPFTHPNTTDGSYPPERRLPGAHYLPDKVRNHVVAMLGEFAGTFLFLFFAFSGTQLANMSTTAAQKGPQPAVLLYIALSFGFSLAVNVWVFFRWVAYILSFFQLEKLLTPRQHFWGPVQPCSMNRPRSPQILCSTLTSCAGHSRALSCWCCWLDPGLTCLHLPNHRSNCSFCPSVRLVSWAIACADETQQKSKNKCHSWSLY